MCTTDKSSSFSQKCLEDYEVISVLGSGSFGTCYKVRDKELDRLFAWKSIDYDELDEAKLDSLVSEIDVLRQLQHPNIVRYYHHLDSIAPKSIFIIMEWCENGDLSHLIAKARIEQKRFDEQYIWRVLFQICKALQVCHTQLKQGTVLHRDIKPANIFLDHQWNAKLGDFGLARLVQRSERFAKSFVGTPYYMSPEIIKNTHYDCKADVWALGCLIYEMAALHRPFNGRKLQQLSVNIVTGNYASKLSSIYGEELQQIISFMLEIDETKRPSVEVIVRHPNVVKNINADIFLKPLVKAEEKFIKSQQEGSSATRQQLEYSFSSLDESCLNLGRRLSVSGVFTPDLRNEIFYSANRKLGSHTQQQSDPELYKTARITKIDQQPQNVTQKVFHDQLKERLHAIRAQEALLKRKEEDLAALEQKLNAKESKLGELELKLDKRRNYLEKKMKNFKEINRRKSSSLGLIERTTNTQAANSNRASIALSLESKIDLDDETYCSIEPQDELSPTVAKLNLKTLPPRKLTAPTLRKVTFQSPKRLSAIEQENKPPKLRSMSVNKMRKSNCSSGSSDGSHSDSTNQRRRSLLSLLGIKRNTKSDAGILNELPTQAAASQLDQLPPKRSGDILLKCETEKLTSIWTKENKRAAFDLLAAMNANQADFSRVPCTNATRQSMRQPSRSAHLRSERMRQSMRVFPLALKIK